MTDWYDVLQLLPSASAEAVESSYRRLLEDTPAGEPRRQIDEAYWVLSDPSRRAAFDAFRTSSARQPRPRPRLAPRRVLADAWVTMRRHPRETLLPMAAIQVPVGIAMAVAFSVLFATVFSDDTFQDPGSLASEGPTRHLFILVVLGAIDFLCLWIAFAATMVSTDAVLKEKPVKLNMALDPAFTRMGGLLVLLAVFFLSFVVLVAPILGIFLFCYLSARLAMTLPAFIVGGMRPGAALRESWGRSRGRVLSIFAILLAVMVILTVSLLGLSFLNLFIVGNRTTKLVITAVLSSVQAVALVPLLTWFAVALTHTYSTLRSTDDARTAA